jgi:hypothetical protein
VGTLACIALLCVAVLMVAGGQSEVDMREPAVLDYSHKGVVRDTSE